MKHIALLSLVTNITLLVIGFNGVHNVNAMNLNQFTETLEDAPTPSKGALSLWLSTTDMTNALQKFLPLLSGIVQDYKIPLNINYNTSAANITISSVTVNNVTIDDTAVMKVVGVPNDTNQVYLEIDGFGIGVSAEGEMTAPVKLNLTKDSMTMNKIKFGLQVSTDSTDKVHWSLKDPNVTLNVTEFDIESTDPIQKLVLKEKKVQEEIQKALNELSPALTKEVQKYLDKLNKIIADEDDYTFVLPIKAYNQTIDLNLTMTEQPMILSAKYGNKTENFITLGIDGRFVLPKNSTDKIVQQKLPGQENPSNYKSDFGEANQMTIGEPMLNSLISVLLENYKDKLPLVIKNKNQTSMIMPAFPDVTSAYGKDADYELEVMLALNNSDTSFPIHFDQFHGIQFGAKQNFIVGLNINVPHGGSKEPKCICAFNFNFMGNFNLTMDKGLVFYPTFKSDFARNVEITVDEVGLIQRPGGWDLFFTQVINQLVNIFNKKYSGGIQPSAIVKLVASQLKSATLSPYDEFGYMSGGFSFNGAKDALSTDFSDFNEFNFIQ